LSQWYNPSYHLLIPKDLDVVEGRFSSYFPLPYRVAIIINIGMSPTIR
jgi:hypothetical protein